MEAILNWKEDVYQQLKQRNSQQSYIFEDIYHSNFTKMQENLKINITLFDLKSNLNSIQYEISNLLSINNNPDTKQGLERTKSKIFQLQAGWREPIQLHSVFDQRRLLSLQQEELFIAKKELSSALEIIARMTQELDSEKQNSEARNAEIKILHGLISEYDSKLAGFPRENESMVADKSRTTDQAKAINERVEGKT